MFKGMNSVHLMIYDHKTQRITQKQAIILLFDYNIKQKLNMEQQKDHQGSIQYDISLPHHNSYYLAQQQNDNLWVNDFLDDDIFKIKIHPRSQVSQFQISNNGTFQSLPERQLKQFQQQQSHYSVKNKSLFHNFPKHLLTLVKKIIKIQKQQLLTLPSGLIAFKLYKIFISIKKYAKKYLYIMFGVTQHENIDILMLLSEQVPALNKLIFNVGIEQIQNAQRLLRQIALKQFSSISKQEVMHICKVSKFQQFYKYYINFINELSVEGGTCIRIKKHKKSKLTKENEQLSKIQMQGLFQNS